MLNKGVVSIGHFHAIHVVFVPLEYVPAIPPHSTYVIGICSQNTNYVAMFNQLQNFLFTSFPPLNVHTCITPSPHHTTSPSHHPHHHHPLPCTMPCTTHAPTHAWPSLPVNQNPNPTPPNLTVTGLHDTAAERIKAPAN